MKTTASDEKQPAGKTSFLQKKNKATFIHLHASSKISSLNSSFTFSFDTSRTCFHLLFAYLCATQTALPILMQTFILQRFPKSAVPAIANGARRYV